MDTRYSTSPEAFKRFTTEETRKEFLFDPVFKKDELSAVYSHIDRIVAMGAYPVTKSISLDDSIDSWNVFGVTYVLERREMGVINIGGAGSVSVNGESYDLDHLEALYIPMESKNIVFSSKDSAHPAKFYINSTPAHCPHPLKKITQKDAKELNLGSLAESNKRTIFQYIHPDVLDTCQLSMGYTKLDEGCVWNTMPAHTHERRMEIYFYLEIPENQVVFHLMGEPTQTRHIVVENEQAVINPSWSIHSGCGTSNYAFIWSMAGENRTYSDQNHLATNSLR